MLRHHTLSATKPTYVTRKRSRRRSPVRIDPTAAGRSDVAQVMQAVMARLERVRRPQR